MSSRPSNFTLTQPGPLRIYSTAELITMPPPGWLIDTMLPEGGLTGLYGQPGSGKSFVALDMALSVAAGIDWHGCEVEPGFALYISAEGGPGIGKRVKAWLEQHELPASKVEIGWITEAIPVQANSDEVEHLLRRVEEIRNKPALVVIDTLARCFEGDENQQEDMSAFVRGVDRLRHELKTAVLVVHHTRLDGERERGNTALRGAADAMIMCRRSKGRNGYITLVSDKQKDGAEADDMQFSLTQRAISIAGINTDTCIIEAFQGSGHGAALHKALKAQGVPDDAWFLVHDLETLSGMPRASFFRSLREARKYGLIQKENGRYRVT